jgi:geranylgeranyl diphosphate/geranylgeranyl-bacteriochlorophyllide a reductase
MYDIAIVGAGPAGSTLARLLGDRYRILLADRRRLDLEPAATTLGKPCGGLLAPSAQHELARQGLGVPARVVVGPQLFAVRTIDLEAGLQRLYQRFYVNVDRERFDRWLVSLVPGSVEPGYGWRLTHLERDPDGSFLRFDTVEGGQAGVRARLVIGADGASSLVRRLAFADTPLPQRYTAIQAEYETQSADASYGAVFDASLTDFYGWTIPKGHELVIGIAFPSGPGVAAQFETYVERLRGHGIRFGTRLAVSSAMIARPTSLLHLCPGAGGILLAGEAAGFISPSSAEGISYALKSAAALAGALEHGLAGAGERYRSAAWPLALDVGVKALKSSAIYGAATRRLIMRSGFGAIPERQATAGVPATRFAR